MHQWPRESALKDRRVETSKARSVLETATASRMELHAQLTQMQLQLSQMRKAKIQLLMSLDQALRVLGVNLLAEHLYTTDLDDDVKLRLELCKTIMRERVRIARQPGSQRQWLELIRQDVALFAARSREEKRTSTSLVRSVRTAVRPVLWPGPSRTRRVEDEVSDQAPAGEKYTGRGRLGHERVWLRQ